MLKLAGETLNYVLETLIHNGPVLLLGILAAAAITVYVDPERLQRALMKRSGVSIGAGVAFGAFTPFCACGTMAVIVSMLTTALPWGPVMAFLTSSPLMSPEEFILYSGIVGPNFAIALTAASVAVGFGSGLGAHWLEKHTGFLKGQARLGGLKPAAACCDALVLPVAAGAESSCGCSWEEPTQAQRTSALEPDSRRGRFGAMLQAALKVGLRQVLPYFTLFAAIGYLINRLVPAGLIMEHLGSGNVLAVPLMALVGLPLYVNGSASVPLISMLMDAGAGPGALLAFLITGPGTSAGVIAGLMTVLKGRAIALYVAFLLFFAVVLGYGYEFFLLLL